jgi:MoaA/NifB/PqqE/SkfB family radical SAM enzyme
MNDVEQFSVYNAKGMALSDRIGENPLNFLQGDDDHGWRVARNLYKPLNHLEFLRRKEEIAARLNLHNVLTPPEKFDVNYTRLQDHQQHKLSTPELIEHLAAQLREQGDAASVPEIAGLLQEYATACHLEFHPSDVCNLGCRGCTYGHDDPATKPPRVNFPFAEIKKIARLQARSMLIIGGGEPTLYRSGACRFQEMVEEVLSTNPAIQLALVTNGTYRPGGDWPNRFAWIRISLDAATARTYADFRGKPVFGQVVGNFLRYLDTQVPYVGISFLFARSNVHEYAAVARFIFDLVKQEKPCALPKVNIQYRPLRQNPYQYGKPFAEGVSRAQIARAAREVRELSESSREMEEFLRNQTNITAVLGGNDHSPHEFARCYYSQTFRIIRANGDLRPCFIRVAEPDFVLGNITTDGLATIALNTLYVAARRQTYCDARGCRQCHVNYIFEQGLKGVLKPSTSPEVLADAMY